MCYKSNRWRPIKCIAINLINVREITLIEEKLILFSLLSKNTKITAALNSRSQVYLELNEVKKFFILFTINMMIVLNEIYESKRDISEDVAAKLYLMSSY